MLLLSLTLWNISP